MPRPTDCLLFIGILRTPNAADSPRRLYQTFNLLFTLMWETKFFNHINQQVKLYVNKYVYMKFLYCRRDDRRFSAEL